MRKKFEITIVGAGILGLAVAYRLAQRYPDLKIALLEKESQVAAHQTGRNSGVIHSGIYYKPNSLKANNCLSGKIALEQFCLENQINFKTSGKVIVACAVDEIKQLEQIYQRGIEHKIPCRLIDRAELKSLEPHVNGIKAIHVENTGVVLYKEVCEKLAQLLKQLGVEIFFENKLNNITQSNQELILETNQNELLSKYLINCAGLYSDRIIELSGQTPQARICPFRGEYFKLKDSAKKLCKTLIYPVPDPNFPFLGVHFTRGADDIVECGPNAVFAFGRENYDKISVNLNDTWDAVKYSGFRKLCAKHWIAGSKELWRSINKAAFVSALQKLIPEINADDIEPAPAGIRAQAVDPNGKLVDDFVFQTTKNFVHVCNAPSPAATACFSIADHIVGEFANIYS